MKKIRFKKFQINWKNFLNYILLILLSSFLLLDVLIALPLTEKLTDIVAFDLNVSNNSWSKEYILDLESEDVKDINKTRNILFKRLNQYGVEEVSIYKEDNNLRVVVTTSLAQIYVEELIRNPYQYSIVTRKEDVDFENEEDPYAQYMADNYNDTTLDSSIFRNIHIALLPDSNGTDSYFGIAKVWPNKQQEFRNFLTENTGKSIGLKIDGFVTPMSISDSTIFAIPLGADEESIEAIDILYNSGNIPTSYTISDQKDLEITNSKLDYIEISIAIFVIILVIYGYLYITKLYTTKYLITSLFATVLAIATLLTMLKISFIPVNTYILLIESIIIIILTRVLTTNPESRYLITASTFGISLIMRILGIGYIKIFANDMLIISLLILLCVIFSNYYINNITKYFKK